MVVTLITYKQYAQKVHLCKEIPANTVFVMHEGKEGLSQYPVQYEDGRIAYDYPERVSKAIKPFVELAFIAKKAWEFANKYEGWHTYDLLDKRLIRVLRALQEAKEIAIYEAGHQFQIVRQ